MLQALFAGAVLAAPVPEDTLPDGAIARLGSLAYKHPAAIDLTLDEGQDLLVTAGEVGEILLRRLSDGGVRAAFEPEGLGFLNMVDAIHGDRLIVDRRQVVTWSGATVTELPTEGDDSVREVALRGGTLAGTDRDGHLYVWDPNTYAIEARHSYPREAECFDLSPDGKLAAMGSEQGLEVVTVADGKRRFFVKTGALVEEVAFVGTEHVAWSDGYEEVVLVSTADGAERWRRAPPSADLGSIVTGLGTTGDQAWVVATANLTDAVAWRVSDGQQAPRIPTWPEVTADVHPYGTGPTVALMTRTSVFLWDVAAGRALSTVPGHSGSVLDVTFSPDGTRIATIGRENTVRVWDLAAVRGKASSEASTVLELPGDSPEVVAYDHDGRLVAGGTSGVYLLQPDAPRRIGAASRVERGPDRRLVLSGGILSGAVRLVVGDEEVASFACENPCSAAAFERWIAVASGTEVVLLDEVGKRELHRVDPRLSYVYDVAIGPGGRVAVAGWQVGALFAIEKGGTGPRLQELRAVNKSANLIDPEYSPITAVEISADGRWLASGYLDGTVLVEAVETGHRLPYLRGHLGRIEALAFSPDGVLLASASSDGTAMVWDIARYAEAHPLSTP